MAILMQTSGTPDDVIDVFVEGETPLKVNALHLPGSFRHAYFQRQQTAHEANSPAPPKMKP